MRFQTNGQAVLIEHKNFFLTLEDDQEENGEADGGNAESPAGDDADENRRDEDDGANRSGDEMDHAPEEMR